MHENVDEAHSCMIYGIHYFSFILIKYFSSRVPSTSVGNGSSAAKVSKNLLLLYMLPL